MHKNLDKIHTHTCMYTQSLQATLGALQFFLLEGAQASSDGSDSPMSDAWNFHHAPFANSIS